MSENFLRELLVGKCCNNKSEQMKPTFNPRPMSVVSIICTTYMYIDSYIWFIFLEQMNDHSVFKGTHFNFGSIVLCICSESPTKQQVTYTSLPEVCTCIELGTKMSLHMHAKSNSIHVVFNAYIHVMN